MKLNYNQYTSIFNDFIEAEYGLNKKKGIVYGCVILEESTTDDWEENKKDFLNYLHLLSKKGFNTLFDYLAKNKHVKQGEMEIKPRHIIDSDYSDVWPNTYSNLIRRELDGISGVWLFESSKDISKFLHLSNTSVKRVLVSSCVYSVEYNSETTDVRKPIIDIWELNSVVQSILLRGY